MSRDYSMLIQIEKKIRGAYGYQPLMREARRLMKEYFGWTFRQNAGNATMLDMLMRQCITCEKERIGGEIMHFIESPDIKMTAEAIGFLAKWALDQDPPPPLSVIAACDRVLSWMSGMSTSKE